MHVLWFYIMNTITIKDIPLAVHRRLKSRAKEHGRSLNKEVIYTLESSLHSERIDTATIKTHAKAVREIMDVYLTPDDLNELKSAGRR